MMKKILTALSFLGIILLVTGASAQDVQAAREKVKKLQEKIDASGAKWTAGVNRFSFMTREERKAFLGLPLEAPPVEVDPEFIKKLHERHDALPVSFDWRDQNGVNWMTSVKDQTSCGACAAFASCGAIEVAWRLDEQNPTLDVDLSEQHLFSCGTDMANEQAGYEEFGCSGGWYYGGFFGYPLGTMDYAKYFGIPDEDCNPYQAVDDNCSDSCPNWKSRAYMIDSFGYVSNDGTNIDDIKAALMIRPIATAMTVYEDFFEYSSGVYEHKDGESAGGHAVVITGWSDEDECWIVKNSWNTDWGEDGYFRIKWMDSEFGRTSVLVEPGSEAAPTPTPVYEPGDVCDKAVNATGGGVFSGSTASFNNSVDPSDSDSWPLSWGMPGPDYIYMIDLSSPMSIKATVQTASFDHALYILKFDCNDPSQSFEDVSDEFSDQTGESLSVNPWQNGIYYLIVDSYSRGAKGAFVIDISMNDIIPTPTPTPGFTTTPTPTPTATPSSQLMPAEYIYTFNSSDEGWERITFTGIFDEPAFSTSDERLGLSPGGRDYVFGSWQSPYHSFRVGQKYKAIFRMSSSLADTSGVPTFRLRINDRKSQFIKALTVNSKDPAAMSPSNAGTRYEVIFQPPAAALESGYCFNFDLVNIGDEDDPNSWVFLDELEIREVNVTP